MLILLFLLAPLACFAQKDFDYTLVFHQQTTYARSSVTKVDSVIKTGEWTLRKEGTKATIFGGGGPVKAYAPLFFRGLDRLGIEYIKGFVNISVAPLTPLLRIEAIDTVTVYQ